MEFKSFSCEASELAVINQGFDTGVIGSFPVRVMQKHDVDESEIVTSLIDGAIFYLFFVVDSECSVHVGNQAGDSFSFG